MTGATAFDFNGDGINEVVYRDEDSLRIISGPSGLNLATFPCGAVTGSEYPIVVDINNDAEAEIICTCGTETYNSNNDGKLKAFHAENDPWVNTRNLWNQYPYFIVNINNDMTVPLQQQAHHNVGSPPLGSTGRLNTFLKQVGPFDNNGDRVFPAADIVADVEEITINGCDGNHTSIPVTIELKNLGDLFLPVNTDYSFYIGDPEGNGVYLGTYQTTVPILAGDSLSITLNLDLTGFTSPYALYVIGNDGGLLPPPFDLANDFPVTPVGECEFANNKDSIIVSFSCCLLYTSDAADE